MNSGHVCSQKQKASFEPSSPSPWQHVTAIGEGTVAQLVVSAEAQRDGVELLSHALLVQLPLTSAKFQKPEGVRKHSKELISINITKFDDAWQFGKCPRVLPLQASDTNFAG